MVWAGTAGIGEASQGDLTQWTLQWALPNWELMRAEDITYLTLVLLGLMWGVVGMVLECCGEVGSRLGVNSTVSLSP